MREKQWLVQLGWSVVIRKKDGTEFLGGGRNFFNKRAHAVAHAKECRAHKLKAITRRVRLETLDE